MDRNKALHAPRYDISGSWKILLAKTIKCFQVKNQLFDKNFTWLDSGTHESMLEASNYIHTIEKRTGLKIACIEEIAYKLGYINKKKFHEIINYIGDNQYGDYLKKINNEI